MGTMVNLASAAGLFGIRPDRDYMASKKGVMGLTQAIIIVLPFSWYPYQLYLSGHYYHTDVRDIKNR